MTCPSCANHGVFKVCYHDGDPTDYALCLCPAGEAMRCAVNNGTPCAPRWELWAAVNGVDRERVAPMEDVLTDQEMAERGFTELGPAPAFDAIAAAAKAARSRR